MNSELESLTTAAQVAGRYKILGHAMIYGDHVIASNKIWNDERGAYDHHAAIFNILQRGEDAAHTPVAFATESDEVFADQGHAFAWAINMIEALNN